MPERIIRTIALFTQLPQETHLARLKSLAGRLRSAGFLIQTMRLCSPDPDAVLDFDGRLDGSIYLSMGTLDTTSAEQYLSGFLKARNVAFNLDLSRVDITSGHVAMLNTIIRENPAKTFSFAYTFNNAPGSPYFPSAMYERDGFAVGLQPTDLSAGCRTVEDWLAKLKAAWEEIDGLFRSEADYLGIDTSIAPLFSGDSSLFHFIRRVVGPIERAATGDTFLKISRFIKEEGPRKTGLCGLMYPCLEDFELADMYERGEFSLERNLFLSLHSGLGIDTYPVGIDEDPARILEVLRLVQGLSNKYGKPLSVRFISDGVSRIGQKASFESPYLKNVTIRSI